MPDTKITALAAITTVDPAADVLPIVDISDTSMAASGTTKKITTNQLLGSGGTATLASATITGALGAAGLNVTGATIPANGVYLGSANNLSFSAASTLGMTLNSSGLGVGASPDTGFRLTVKASRALARLESTTGTEDAFYQLKNTGGTFAIGIDNSTGANQTGVGYASYLWGSGAYPFIVATNNAERLRIDSAGNVGVGVTPSAWASSSRAIDFTFPFVGMDSNGAGVFGFNAYNSAAGVWRYKTTDEASRFSANLDGSFSWFNAPSGTAGNAITFTQAMTLDASGNLLVGTSGTSWQTVAGFYYFAGSSLNVTRDGNACQLLNRLTSDGIIVDLRRSANAVGNISVTTTGATFNSTSDYRLKESVAPLSDGLARVNALKPSVYKWKSNGSDGEGFLAHELAEVVPAAVNGEKDAMNEDGTIKAQSIDMSRIVPILVAAIKELTARVEALEA